MSTIINNPPTEVSDNSGTGVVVGILLALVIVILFVIFGLPYLRGRSAEPVNQNPGVSGSINVTIPTGSPTPDNGGSN